jgi:hypothetical protein
MARLLTRHWKLAILWALSLVAVGAISSLAQAQGPGQRSGLQFNFLTESPTVVSGNDVGFRIERTQDGILIGRLVVRVDGRWVDTGVPAR